jgi:hypothetical protein
MSKLSSENIDYVISYQSRVGPMKWIGPSTDAEIIKYSKEKKGIVIVPVAFVPEHSNTKATGTITIPFFSLEYLIISASVDGPIHFIGPTRL